MTRRVFLFFLFLALQGGSAIADQQPSETEWWHVRDALFTALPDSTYDEERVTRWVEQPVVVVLGATDEDQRYVKETVNEFNRLLGPVAIRIEAEDDIDANIGILIAPNRLFPQLASRHGMQVNIAMRGAGYTELTVRPDHAVRSSVTLVSDELEDTDRDATLIHELYHAMGPSGHSRRFEDSVIFQNADATSTATELAPIDIKLLALLYGYLSPGDTEADVRAAFDRHWIELDEFVTPTATCNCRRERHGPRKVE